MPSSNNTRKEYLGDSVYVEVEDGMLKLTTENGGPPSNTIFLEYHVFIQLERYVKQLLDTATTPNP